MHFTHINEPLTKNSKLSSFVQKNINRLPEFSKILPAASQVSALDKHCTSPERANLLGGASHVRLFCYRESHESFCLGNVWSDDTRQRQEFLLDGAKCIVVN